MGYRSATMKLVGHNAQTKGNRKMTEQESKTIATGGTIVVRGNGLEIQAPEYKTELTYTVPSDPEKVKPGLVSECGKKIPVEFTFARIEDNDVAVQICEAKGWNLVDFVNDALKSNARASAYQNEAAKYKPSTMSEDEAIEKMVNDYQRLFGIPEDVARAQVTSLLSNR